MDSGAMTGEQIRRAGLEALVRELGPEGAIRFMQQFDTGSGDYTDERQQLLPELSVDDLVRRIADRRGGQRGGHT